MEHTETTGVILVSVSYIIWGILSIFWSLLSEVSSLYILAHRIVWSVVFMGLYIALSGRWHEITEVFKDKRTLLICLASGILITVNWGTYIMAVTSGHVLDASLGYFIEPIAVAMIGVLLFKERMSRKEIITFVFAAAGLIYMIVVSRTVPMMALIIAVSFSAYGAVKKSLNLTAHTSLFMETLCVAPLAIALIIYMESNGTGSIGILHGTQYLLLPACGIVTSVPLLLFNTGIKQIPYYLTGILNYISPSIQFLIGLLYFHEALDVHRFIAFVLIWVGILFTVHEKAKLIKATSRSECHT